MALKDIVGQERALNILQGSIARNRIAHAYLFAGESGIGKRLTAINFIKALNCQNLKGSNESPIKIDCCDKCPSCLRIDKGAHPDVFFIAPEGDGGQIKVAVIRKLIEDISFKSFEGGWKAVVMDEAESINQEAANAFLKTLEEPPEKTVFILISSMPDMLLSTIRSRCQRINFSPLPLAEMSSMLEENLELKTQNSKLICMLSSGRLGVALAKDLIEKRDASLNEIKMMLGNIEDAQWEDRGAMEEWFEWVELWLRDLSVLRATGRTELLINYDRAEELKEILKACSLQDILKLAEGINNIKNTLRFNLNKDITLYYAGLLLKRAFGGINVRG
ncbi:MAG: DNA polymerase III subunit delta' [Nitrospirae bacterium]|nr:DNA polymerase III subunit delta' [Nitrospirota bacterium]